MQKFILIVNKKISLINQVILNLYFPEDLMKMDELVENSVRESSIDIDKSSSVLKVGCLLACLLQKKEMVIFKKTILIILNIFSNISNNIKYIKNILIILNVFKI